MKHYLDKQQVKNERQQRGLSHARAAHYAGVSERTWKAYECGERPMPYWRWDLFNRRTLALLPDDEPDEEMYGNPAYDLVAADRR